MTNWAKIIIGDSRAMPEVADEAIDLAVTSPPYWQIKNYGAAGQVGYGQTLHEYLRDLYCVWRECFRVLREGCRLCLNIGDQFARAAVYGRYKVIPLHAEFIGQCERIGFDFLGSVIWQKKTTVNPSGGATVMGSYPYPANGIVELDYEFILIFKKPGAGKKVSTEVKEASRLAKEEWKIYFAGHWYFGGARQLGHEAMFPEELPRRLIRMFSFVGDTVLDPFLGSGTTVRVALEQGRNAVGYEINPDFLETIRQKIAGGGQLFNQMQIIRRERQVAILPPGDYVPGIQDAAPLGNSGFETNLEQLDKVNRIIDENTIELSSGQKVQFLGVKIAQRNETLEYLRHSLAGKKVIIKNGRRTSEGMAAAYVYLKNKIFINAYLIKSGLGEPDPAVDHELKKRFESLILKRDGVEGRKP